MLINEQGQNPCFLMRKKEKIIAYGKEMLTDLKK